MGLASNFESTGLSVCMGCSGCSVIRSADGVVRGNVKNSNNDCAALLMKRIETLWYIQLALCIILSPIILLIAGFVVLAQSMIRKWFQVDIYSGGLGYQSCKLK